VREFDQRLVLEHPDDITALGEKDETGLLALDRIALTAARKRIIDLRTTERRPALQSVKQPLHVLLSGADQQLWVGPKPASGLPAPAKKLKEELLLALLIDLLIASDEGFDIHRR
jgi:hypothetical protein